jgi:parallel beta-helix repeat protein
VSPNFVRSSSAVVLHRLNYAAHHVALPVRRNAAGAAAPRLGMAILLACCSISVGCAGGAGSSNPPPPSPAGTSTISGIVSPTQGGSGATLWLSGSASATSTTTDGSGNYSFTGLSDGSYIVRPTKPGFNFSPARQNVLVKGGNLTGVNFTADSALLPTISGTISPANHGNGATVTLGGASSSTTTADASGNYNFVGLAAGSYTVTASKNGFHFSPASQNVTVSASGASGVNFIVFSQSASVDILPGQDIASAVKAAAAGTAFIIHPGTYRLTQPIIPKDGDLFLGQTVCSPPTTSCPAIISGSTVIGPLATFNGTNYKVTGQTQRGEVNETTEQCIPGWLACNIPEDLWFDGVPLQHLYASSLSTIASGQWWFDYTNHVIYFHDNPSGHLVETSVAPSVAVGPANNVAFQYLTIEEFATPLTQGGLWPSNGQVTDALRQANGLNWIVENCEMWGHHSAAIAPNYGMQVLNNYIHDNGQLGIGGGFGPDNNLVGSGLLVQGNLVTHNNYANVSPNFGAGGIKFGRTRGAVIKNNTVTNNEGSGIHFDVSSSSPVIVGNTITGNTDGDGIIYEISWVSALVYNNVLQYNGVPSIANNHPGYQIHSLNSTGMNAYCNVMEMSPVSTEQGWNVGASDRGNDGYPPGSYYVSVGNYIHHNTVIWDTTAGAYVGSTQTDGANQPNFFTHNTPPDFNTYHLSSLSAADFIYDDNNSQNNTRQAFANYQANGADVHGAIDTNNTSGFPTVAITSPADQSSFRNSVAVTAEASDASGISKVDFYVDWVLQSTVSAPPYSATLTSGSGQHVVAAMASSNAGISACYAVRLNNQ